MVFGLEFDSRLSLDVCCLTSRISFIATFHLSYLFNPWRKEVWIKLCQILVCHAFFLW